MKELITVDLFCGAGGASTPVMTACAMCEADLEGVR